ncbi:uncharacterized protein LOC130622228 [Hydractinia symbiolongicarpus]|uniref:uncharacterized protein LOC130622228 n=1 Tax=Hydractinia symbiolongicarpus TaxID=13093 RepID=UPI00254BB4C2|nr:uncharacterized protein LOC130622228 [Hydractinia symbiolongicarpus]
MLTTYQTTLAEDTCTRMKTSGLILAILATIFCTTCTAPLKPFCRRWHGKCYVKPTQRENLDRRRSPAVLTTSTVTVTDPIKETTLSTVVTTTRKPQPRRKYWFTEIIYANKTFKKLMLDRWKEHILF